MIGNADVGLGRIGTRLRGMLCLAAALLTLWAGPGAMAQSQYTIQAGDTLQALSVRFKVSVDDIVSANAVLDPNKIYPGKVITLPANITPPAGYQGAPAAATKLPEKDAPGAADDRPRPSVTQTSPKGILLLTGLTRRPIQEAWDFVLSECDEERCTGSILVENIGETRVEGLAIGQSFWYYRTKMSHSCGALDPGQTCEIKVTYERGYTSGSPGMVLIEAGDARLRPDKETVYFSEEVFWICPAADLPRCQDKAVATAELEPEAEPETEPAPEAAPEAEAAPETEAP